MSKVDEDEGLKSMHEQFLVAEAVIHDVERQGRSGSSMEVIKLLLNHPNQRF